MYPHDNLDCEVFSVCMCIAEFRPDCAETVRWISSVYADVAFQYILERIEEQLSKSACRGDGGISR